VRDKRKKLEFIEIKKRELDQKKKREHVSLRKNER
jgi:hypothetical protein